MKKLYAVIFSVILGIAISVVFNHETATKIADVASGDVKQTINTILNKKIIAVNNTEATQNSSKLADDLKNSFNKSENKKHQQFNCDPFEQWYREQNLNTNTKNVVGLCQKSFYTVFDKSNKSAIYSAELLNKELLSAPKISRTDNFAQNPAVQSEAQASLDVYRGSGFDRGHLAPAADMYAYGEDGMSDSFYLTNIVPQVGANNNRDLWAEVESETRNFIQKNKGDFIVLTGPVYQHGVKIAKVKSILVPTHLFKIIYDLDNKKVARAYLVKNNQIVTRKTRKLENGNRLIAQTTKENAITCKDKCKTSDFLSTQKEIEQITNIEFNFAKFQDSVNSTKH